MVVSPRFNDRWGRHRRSRGGHTCQLRLSYDGSARVTATGVSSLGGSGCQSEGWLFRSEEVGAWGCRRIDGVTTPRIPLSRFGSALHCGVGAVRALWVRIASGSGWLHFPFPNKSGLLEFGNAHTSRSWMGPAPAHGMVGTHVAGPLQDLPWATCLCV